MPRDGQSADAPTSFEKSGHVGKLIYVAVLLAIIAVGLLGAKFVFGALDAAPWRTIVFDHFPATVGLPSAAAAAAIVVALFRTTEGEIKFEVPGFKFEGASGPIVMWILCFLAIVLSIRTLWGDPG